VQTNRVSAREIAADLHRVQDLDAGNPVDNPRIVVTKISVSLAELLAPWSTANRIAADRSPSSLLRLSATRAVQTLWCTLDHSIGSGSVISDGVHHGKRSI
jgi:hypothetical protein